MRHAVLFSIAAWAAGCDCGAAPPADPPAVEVPEAEASAVHDGRLSVGSGHACVTRNGRALCWGQGWGGQLGDGTTTSREEARLVSGRGGVVGVVADGDRSCAWYEDGNVSCWGRADFQDGMTVTPLPVRGLTAVTSIAIVPSQERLCAIHRGGRVSCFSGYALGRDESVASVPVTGVEDAAQLALNDDIGCARTSAGAVSCWRFEDENALLAERSALEGVERISLDPTGYALLVIGGAVQRWTPFGGAPRPVPDLRDVIDVSAGNLYDCALERSGTVRCWDDPGSDRPSLFGERPVAVGRLEGASAIAGQGWSRCALAEDEVRCWGDATLWIPDTLVEATVVPGIEDAEEVVAGGLLTCVRHADGGASCWGRTGSGALGREGDDEALSPRRIFERDVARLYVGGRAAVCAEDETGAVRCLGHLPVQGEDVADPTIVPELARADSLLHDGGGACVRRGGSWRCYGDIATTPEMARYDLVLATALGSCGMRDDRLTCWTESDANSDGEPRLWQSERGRPDAMTISDATGSVTLCALYAGAVLCGGLDGDLYPFEGIEGARAIADFGDRTCALMEDGNVRCVQFSDDGGQIRYEVRGISGAVALAAGYSHACALLRGGRVACVGALRQRGDGFSGFATDAVPIALALE